jgi:hypothetical protein
MTDVKYGKWNIHPSLSPLPSSAGTDWAFYHDDYDGAEDANDPRHGYGPTIEDCKAQIDDMEAD